jgi:hypothetical protein
MNSEWVNITCAVLVALAAIKGIFLLLEQLTR